MSLPEEEVFGEALEFSSAAERRAYLVGACGGDAGLLARLEQLLASHEEAEGEAFMPLHQAVMEAPVREGEGSVIDHYKLLQKIGEGGFGVVYLAEQKEPIRRRVALKIIKLGMDTRQTIGRFEAERQALALMNHPNIARVFDAGSTASGRPYFVMELVRGVPLMQFCDDHKLTTEARLELFLQICGAIEHAHQKGIIHRDLKPSNVIVTMHQDRPMPKVIDFGIAKAMQQDLTDKTLFTRYEEFVGTPAYMSPEQAQYSGFDVDTRSDIYSLGVMLYELLAGRPPFDNKELLRGGIDELRRRICQEEPPRPSTHVKTLAREEMTRLAGARSIDPIRFDRLLRGELDWIILEAMDKDRQRRYQTASALADDIRAYLADEPVSACPPTAVYRLRKFARRHRFPLVLAASVIAALTIGAVVSAALALRASRAERLARVSQQEATDQLWNAYLAQSTLASRSHTVGQRHQTLESVRRAAAIKPSTALRNNALAALALPDLRQKEAIADIDRPDGATLVFNDSGSFYALGHAEGNVEVIRRNGGLQLCRLPAQTGPVDFMQFSPDDKRLAVFHGTDRPGLWRVVVWELDKPAILFAVDDVQRSIGFGPSGKLAAVCTSEPAVVILDLATGESLRRLATPQMGVRMVFSADGQSIAIGGNRSTVARVFDVDSGEERAALQHESSIFEICWDPTGRWLLTATGDFNCNQWDWTRNKVDRVFRGHASQVYLARYHPGGVYLFTSSWDGKSRIWNARSGDLLMETPGNFVALSADGRTLRFDYGTPESGLWEFTEPGAIFRQFRLEGSPDDKVVDLAFPPEGSILAAGGGAELVVWDLTHGLAAARAEVSGVRRLLFVDEGRALLANGSSSGVQRWAIEKASEEKPPDAIRVREHLVRGRVDRFARGPGGSLLAFLRGWQVQVIDLADPAAAPLVLNAQAGATDLAVSPDGRWLATSSWQGVGVRVWDLTQPEGFVAMLENEPVTAVAFTADSRWLLTGSSSSYQRRKIGSWEVDREVVSRARCRMAVDPGGRYFACTLDDLGVALLRLDTFEMLARFQPPHAEPFADLEISPDGRYLAAATTLRNVLVWNLAEIRGILADLGLDWD